MSTMHVFLSFTRYRVDLRQNYPSYRQMDNISGFMKDKGIWKVGLIVFLSRIMALADMFVWQSIIFSAWMCFFSFTVLRLTMNRLGKMGNTHLCEGWVILSNKLVIISYFKPSGFILTHVWSHWRFPLFRRVRDVKKNEENYLST